MSFESAYWSQRSVFVTGHTGFKGGWLVMWLHKLGARIHGFALDPPTQPNLFDVASIGSLLASDARGDIRDISALRSSMETARPDNIFHLAAQPLVRESYLDPIRTWSANVIGTANVLEAARKSPSVRAVVVVTTDKVYESDDSPRSHPETDPLGGRDPYSASKAGAELVAASYRSSFFSSDNGAARIATARAGNAIGGADWSKDRLIPDCLRAFDAGRPVRLRNPRAVRPWQHVLEPLSGYLLLAERLGSANGREFATSWNFGPETSGYATVAQVAAITAQLWGVGATVEHSEKFDTRTEDQFLALDVTRARTKLGWAPRWSLRMALQQTISWHRQWTARKDMLAASLDQIGRFEADD